MLRKFSLCNKAYFCPICVFVALGDVGDVLGGHGVALEDRGVGVLLVEVEEGN